MRRINGLLPTARSSATLIACIAVAIGCQDKSAPPPRPPTTQIISERPLPPLAQPTLIKQGKPTLVYLAETDATLRFVDLTADNTELARVLVKPRQIVRIDARRGVMLGETVIKPGPLPKDHQYGIWLEPETAGGMRDTHVKTMPAPAPAPAPTGANEQPKSQQP